jgi:hypothetical protein
LHADATGNCTGSPTALTPEGIYTRESRALICIEFVVGKGWIKDFVLQKQSIARKGGALCPWL